MSVCFAIVKIEMGVFVWNGVGMGKKRTGCPSTPIHGQPTLHDDCPYIDIMQNVKNFVQKLNYIHSLLKCSGLVRLCRVADDVVDQNKFFK